jgi:uncharacterized protein (TIGR03382 family)
MIALLTGSAWVGVLAGAAGSAAPTSAHTQVVTWRDVHRTTATFRQDVTGGTENLAWITPVPGPVTDVQAVPSDASAFAALDSWSAPRVLAPSCGDLVKDQHVGCGESPPEVAPGVPVDRWMASTAPEAVGSWEVVIKDEGPDVTDSLTAWLSDNAIVLPEGAADAIAAAAEGGDVFVAALWKGAAPPAGSWLPPVTISWNQASFWELPLRSTNPNTIDLHDSVIWTITEAGSGLVVNYVNQVLEDGCMPPVGTPEEWYDQELTALLPLGEILPQVGTELVSSTDSCADCPGPAPSLTPFGWDRGTALITRLHMRYAPVALTQDVHLAERLEAPEPFALDLVDYDPDLEFAFEVCGEGFRDHPGSCPDVKIRSRAEEGCATTGPGVGILSVLVAAFAIRRRRVVALALALSGTAGAAEVPHSALAFEVPIWSTVRLGDDVSDARGSPSLQYPMIGVDGRVALAEGQSSALALAGGIRAWAGHAGLDRDLAYSIFGFVEPHAGLDATWGRMGDHWFSPTGSLGAELAIGLLDPSIWKTTASAGPLLRARVGGWLGNRDHTRTEVSLQLSGIPRFDRRVVSFAPETGLPGWTWHPGTFNVNVVVGGVFGRS